MGFVMLLFVSSTYAQGSKIACVDLFKVFKSYSKTKEADTYLKNKANTLQKDIDKMKGEVASLQKLISSGVLSKEEKAKKSKELSEKKSALNQKIKSSNLVMMEERKAKIDKVIKDLEKKIEEFAKENGYILLMDKRNALYVDENLDVTDKVIKFVNGEK